jgi:hypothetical protein
LISSHSKSCPHSQDARLVSLDPCCNHVGVKWLAPVEVAVEVDRIGVQPIPSTRLRVILRLPRRLPHRL